MDTDICKQNIIRATESRLRRMYYCWILSKCELCDIIDTFKHSFFEHPLSHQCTEYECNHNVRLIFPGIPRTLVKHGRAICKKCLFTCRQCDEECALSEMQGYGVGTLYHKLCADCCRCEHCNEIMWDYVCRCQVF